MKKNLKKIIIIISLVAVLAIPSFVLAASESLGNLETVGAKGNAPYVTATENSMAEIVATVIKAFLGLLGIIFLILIIYAGYNWMTAQGDEEKVTKAKETIQRAIIGLIIIIAAYSITAFVFSGLSNSAGGGGVVGGSPD